MATATNAAGGAIDRRTLARRGAIAIVGSVVANWIVLWIVLTGDLAEPFDPLAYEPVGLFSALGAVGATIVYALLTRYADRPNRTFTIVAAVVLVLSFIPDVALLEVDPEATVAGVVVLMLMHVVAAVVCVAALTGGEPGWPE